MEPDKKLSLPVLRHIAYRAPIIAILLLFILYLLWPQFYLRFVIERSLREYQAVEILTVLFGLAATVVLFRSTVALWKRQRPTDLSGPGMMRKMAGSGVWIVGTCCLATFFFTGEELNWGQTFIHWGIPENEKPYQVNIHNSLEIPLTIMQIGDIFLLIFFFGLPILWQFRDHFGLPDEWGPAIPEWPVILAILVSVTWEKVKYLYLMRNSASSDLYIDFLEEVNEHKEMLLAFSFLMYGLFVLAHCRAAGEGDKQSQ